MKELMGYNDGMMEYNSMLKEMDYFLLNKRNEYQNHYTERRQTQKHKFYDSFGAHQ